jgi:hypothetical protein
MNKAKADPAKPQQAQDDDPGFVAWRKQMAVVGDRNRAALDKARREGATHWQREGFRRGDDGKMHPYSEAVVVDEPEPNPPDDEAIAAVNAEIDRVRTHNRRYLARLKPHELALLEARLRTRSHVSLRPTSTIATSSGRAPREARNQRQRGSRRGERATSSSSDDPGPGSEPPTRRLCAFCNGDIPADRSPKATHCTDQHADRDRQRRKRERDRARNHLPRIPTTADFWRMRELTSDELLRLRGRVACRCNGDHQEFDPGSCFRCGHWLPHVVRLTATRQARGMGA